MTFATGFTSPNTYSFSPDMWTGNQPPLHPTRLEEIDDGMLLSVYALLTHIIEIKVYDLDVDNPYFMCKDERIIIDNKYCDVTQYCTSDFKHVFLFKTTFTTYWVRYRIYKYLKNKGISVI